MSDPEDLDPLARIARLEQAAVHQAAITGAVVEQLRSLAAMNTALAGALRGTVDIEAVRTLALGAFPDAVTDAAAAAQVNAMPGPPPPPPEPEKATPEQLWEAARSRLRVIEGGQFAEAAG